MKILTGFTPITFSQVAGKGVSEMLSFEIQSQFAERRSINGGKGKTLIKYEFHRQLEYGTDLTFIQRFSENEFPSMIAYLTECRSFTGKHQTYVSVELDKPERIRQFTTKLKYRVLSILN